uniref:Uncharacterized protein n=1 Tax=Opuntia streptacantha TaxID=393608 RepID=A0A7C8ZRE6_OPUST
MGAVVITQHMVILPVIHQSILWFLLGKIKFLEETSMNFPLVSHLFLFSVNLSGNHLVLALSNKLHSILHILLKTVQLIKVQILQTISHSLPDLPLKVLIYLIQLLQVFLHSLVLSEPDINPCSLLIPVINLLH